MSASDASESRLGFAAARRLAAAGHVDIGPGLTDAEFTRVESDFGFEFVDDHRAFLAVGLPQGDSWPDWRSGTRRLLRSVTQLPVDGVLFAVEWNDYWDDRWERRPARMKDALRTARYRLERVPRMVPVFGHYFLPAGRGSSAHPVLSVYQTEISCYADDLAHLIDKHFGDGQQRPPTVRPTVEFWSDLVR